MKHMFHLVIVILFSVRSVAALADLQRKIALEQSLVQHLQQELSSILPRQSFGVFASIDLVSQQVREIVEGEVISQETSGRPEQGAVRALPGFEGLGAELSKNAAERPRERQLYKTVERDEIRKVDVEVVLDSKLSEELTSAAKAIIGRRISSSFGAKGNVVFSSMDLSLPKQQGAPSVVGWLNELIDFVRQKWHWLIFSVLVFIALLTLFRRFFSKSGSNARPYHEDQPMMVNEPGNFYALPKSDPRSEFGLLDQAKQLASRVQYHLQLPPNSYEPQAQHQEGHAVKEDQTLSFEQTLESFVSEVSSDVFAARSYFRSIKPDTKSKIFSCFHTSAFKDVLERMLGLSPEDSSQNPGQPEQNPLFLSAIVNELKQYKRLVAVQIKQQFGILNLLTDDEINGILKSFSSDEQVCLLRSLPKSAVTRIFSNISDESRLPLMKSLANLGQSEQISVETLEKIVEQKVNELAQRMLRPNEDPQNILDILIESAGNHKELLGYLAVEKPDLAQKYSEYLISFEDLFNANQSKVSEVVDLVSNEAIALALLNEGDGNRQKVYTTLSPSRRSMVGSLILSLRNRKQQNDIDQAKREVVKAMRSVLRSGEGYIAI